MPAPAAAVGAEQGQGPAPTWAVWGWGWGWGERQAAGSAAVRAGFQGGGQQQGVQGGGQRQGVQAWGQTGGQEAGQGQGQGQGQGRPGGAGSRGLWVGLQKRSSLERSSLERSPRAAGAPPRVEAVSGSRCHHCPEAVPLCRANHGRTTRAAHGGHGPGGGRRKANGSATGAATRLAGHPGRYCVLPHEAGERMMMGWPAERMHACMVVNRAMAVSRPPHHTRPDRLGLPELPELPQPAHCRSTPPFAGDGAAPPGCCTPPPAERWRACVEPRGALCVIWQQRLTYALWCIACVARRVRYWCWCGCG